MTGMDVVEFVEARLVEDTADAASGHSFGCHVFDPIGTETVGSLIEAARTDPEYCTCKQRRRLRDVEAKQLAVAECDTARKAAILWVDKHLATLALPDGDEAWRRMEYEKPLRAVVRFISTLYVEHPDFDPAWKLS